MKGEATWDKGKGNGARPTKRGGMHRQCKHEGEHEGEGGLLAVVVVVAVEVVVSEVVLEVLFFVGIGRVVNGDVVDGPINKIEMVLVLDQEDSFRAKAGVPIDAIKWHLVGFKCDQPRRFAL